MVLQVLGISTLSVAIYMCAVFLLAQALRDNSIVDIAYGGAFIVAVASAGALAATGHPRQYVAAAMVALWGLRLAIHLLFRHRGRGEDFRYRKWREEWGPLFLLRSFFQIYVLQGIVVLIIASPVLYLMTSPGAKLGILDLTGLLLWTVGFVFEAVGDLQLLLFKRIHPTGERLSLPGSGATRDIPTISGNAPSGGAYGWWPSVPRGLSGPLSAPSPSTSFFSRSRASLCSKGNMKVTHNSRNTSAGQAR